MITQKQNVKYAKATAGETCQRCKRQFTEGEMTILRAATGTGRTLVCQDSAACLDRALELADEEGGSE